MTTTISMIFVDITVLPVILPTLQRELSLSDLSLQLPATQGIIVSHFPPHQRGRAIGLFVSIGSIFLALGPLIGGTLASYLSWHYVFWINIPIAVLGLVMTFFSVPAMVGKKNSFDYAGFLILAIGMTSLIFALMQAQSWGWSSLRCLALFIIGIVSLIFLFKRKHKPHASILDFKLMKTKTFIASASSVFCNQLLIMVTVFWAIYFQNILEFSVSKAGMYAFLANVPVLFAAPLGGFLVDRCGPRVPVMSGFGIICFSLSWFALFMRHENIWLLLPTLLLFGFGVSMIFTPSYVSMMNEVPAEKRGAASGITSALRQFGSTLGLALFGSFYSLIYFEKLGYALHKKTTTMSLLPKQFEGLLSKSSTAMHNMQHLPSDDALYVFQSAKNAFLDAFLSINFHVNFTFVACN